MLLENRTILVVDDDVDLCDFCAVVLKSQGAQVLCANSVPEGLKLAQEARPDLVVLDIIMEEADSGFQLASRLSKDYPGLPIIMLSSIAEASSQVFDTSTLPVHELVEKPMAPQDLLNTVKRLLDKVRR